MLSRQFLYGAQVFKTVRWFTCSSISRDINKIDKTARRNNKSENIIGTRMHRVTDFDKRVLVWVKRYPNIAEVPQDVTTECLLAARSKARIKLCNYMIVATVIGCISSVLLGKRQAAKGENLIKQREDWYKEALTEKDK